MQMALHLPKAAMLLGKRVIKAQGSFEEREKVMFLLEPSGIGVPAMKQWLLKTIFVFQKSSLLTTHSKSLLFYSMR